MKTARKHTRTVPPSRRASAASEREAERADRARVTGHADRTTPAATTAEAKAEAVRVAALSPADREAERVAAAKADPARTVNAPSGSPTAFAPKTVPAAFPARDAGFPKVRPLPSITVNGNLKTEKDGVKAEMTVGEIAALDKITTEKFVRLDYHNSITKQGKGELTDVNAALAITDGMEFVAVSR